VAIFERDEEGFFTEVCGQPVIKESCVDLDTTSWDKGHPLGVMFHYQAGCGDSLAGLYRGQGYAEAHASVSQAAEIRQYLPLRIAGWHAREASKRYIGLEHAVKPGSCEITDDMLEASARFFAASVAFVKDRFDVTIPVVKVPWPEFACDIDQMGFREHHDGINASGFGGCFWNDLVHVDGLRRWTWKQFCTRVNENLAGEGEELTPEQEKALERVARFLDTLTEQLGQVGGNERTRAGEDPASPAGAAKRLARMILKSEEE
jgi:hypothetical protein